MKKKCLSFIGLVCFCSYVNNLRSQHIEEPIATNVAEYCYFSPTAHYIALFKRIADFSTEGPYTYEMSIKNTKTNEITFKDTLIDAYADQSNVFWNNDDMLFIAKKGVLEIRSKKYISVILPNFLDIINYDISANRCLYVTADSRGTVLKSLQNGKELMVKILQREQFEAEGIPSITINWDRSQKDSYVYENNESTIDIIQIDSKNNTRTKWRSIGFNPNYQYQLFITKTLMGLFSEEEKCLVIYNSMGKKILDIKNVFSACLEKDTIYFASSVGLINVDTNGKETKVILKQDFTGYSIQKITKEGYYFSISEKQIWEGDSYQGEMLRIIVIRH